VAVHPSKRKKSFVAHFELDICQNCPFSEACPGKPGKRDPRRHLRFTQAQTNVAHRRKRNRVHLEEAQNLRAAVEATVRQIKHPFPAGKLPVRGQFRVTCMVIGSAVMSNIRRIQRYKAMNEQQTNQKKPKKELEKGHPNSFLNNFLHPLFYRFICQMYVFCC
jgi:hypothetical protein